MKGDFLGFSFDGIHCSELGITHVSSSDRYDEELFPEVRDKTVEIPNNHGEYYYGSTYGTRTFEIEFAYDSVTEVQFRKIRKLFGTRRICDLIFDERPYKVYHAKIESPLEMSYICFDEEEKIADTEGRPGVRVEDRTYTQSTETKTVNFTVPAQSTYTYTLPENAVADDVVILPDEAVYTVEDLTYTFTNEAAEPLEVSVTFLQNVTNVEITRETVYPWIKTGKKQRIYKGEGKVSLICYFPFATQLFKTKELYLEAGEDKYGNLKTVYTNVDEWIESSGILTAEEREENHIDRVVHNQNGLYNYTITVYNPGDLNTGFYLYIPFINNKILPFGKNKCIIINGDTNTLFLKPITMRPSVNRLEQTGILINTVNHLIEGVSFSQVVDHFDFKRKGWQTTGNIYNDAIEGGDFPKIIRSDWSFNENQKQAINISCQEGVYWEEEEQGRGISVYYDYLYF